MRNYDFKSLNDKDFEILACDVLSAENKVRFERFKQGKDNGIDGRYFSVTGDQTILQCKHWPRSSILELLRQLRSKELPKLVKLNPNRYLLVTSLELSPNNKAAIKEALSPYVISEADIFGKEDINDLIGKHKDIERQHYKLWLSGTNVLDSILHNAILGRSDFVVKDILEGGSKYVKTEIHIAAANKLANEGVVIITGEPGVGKTTLAEQLCLQYVKIGFQLVVLDESIEEAEAIYSKEKLQVFYFDDFLGRNYLSALGRHEDTHIVSFIRRISKDKTKRFILTSRTNILNQGKRLTDTFSISKIDRTEFEVRLNALTPYEKSELLYNHIWFSELEMYYIEEILKDKRYSKIIKHKNFNPRLISFVTDTQRLTDVPAKDYWKFINEKLKNPVDVWEHTYESQLDDYSRAIVIIVVLNAGRICEEDLRNAYYQILEDPIATGYSGRVDFFSNIRTLSGSLLNRNISYYEEIMFSLFNPSVADFVINRIKDDSRLIEAVLLATSTERSFNNLSALVRSSIVSYSIAKNCFVSLVKKYIPDSSKQLNTHCKLTLIENAIFFIEDDYSLLDRMGFYLKTLSPDDLSEINNSRLLGEILSKLLEKKLVSEDLAWQLLSHIQLDELDRPEFEALTPICKYLSKERQQELSERLKPTIIEFWKLNITQEIVDSGILSGVCSITDKDAATEIIFYNIHDLLSEYGLQFREAEIQSVVNNCNVVQIIEDNIYCASLVNDYEDYIEHGEALTEDRIDELFNADFSLR